jgi:hypothetical protein
MAPVSLREGLIPVLLHNIILERHLIMSMTSEEIEADIKAVRANPNWASDPVLLSIYAELLRLRYRDRLIETPVPQPLPGKY